MGDDAIDVCFDGRSDIVSRRQGGGFGQSRKGVGIDAEVGERPYPADGLTGPGEILVAQLEVAIAEFIAFFEDGLHDTAPLPHGALDGGRVAPVAPALRLAKVSERGGLTEGLVVDFLKNRAGDSTAVADQMDEPSVGKHVAREVDPHRAARVLVEEARAARPGEREREAPADAANLGGGGVFDADSVVPFGIQVVRVPQGLGLGDISEVGVARQQFGEVGGSGPRCPHDEERGAHGDVPTERGAPQVDGAVEKPASQKKKRAAPPVPTVRPLIV